MGSDRGQVLTRLEGRRRQTALAGDRRVSAYSRRQLRRRQVEWLRSAWKGLVVLAVLFAFLALMNLVLMWRPLRPYVTGGIVASFFWALHVLMIQTGDVSRWQVGVEAETWTAQALRGLRRHGWRLVNHVPTDGPDIDHALIGPGGYVAVETKYRSVWKTDPATLDPMVRQANRAARQLGARMKLRAGLSARPVVVAWGPGSEAAFGRGVEIDGVLFVSGHQLRQALASLPPLLDDAQIDAAYAALDAYVSKVDLGETDKHGPLPTTVGQLVNHTGLVLLSAMGAMLAVLFAVRMPPTGWWSVAVAAALVTAAALLRRRLQPVAQVRHATTAVITTAAATGGTILAFLVVAHLA